MGRRAETKVGRIYFVPVHTRYVVVQYRSAAALGAVGRPSEIPLIFKMSGVGKGLTPYPHRGSAYIVGPVRGLPWASNGSPEAVYHTPGSAQLHFP